MTYSWPWGLRTAWCCMLANPQNLNISSFLESPTSSPFAVALRASKVMLVVPNRHQSVYTRLWCLADAEPSFSGFHPEAGLDKMPQHKIAHWNLIVCRLGASITGGFYNTQRHPISHDVELKINYLLFPAIRASPRIVQLRCAYEAYLAQEEGKTILIAHSSHFPQILAALRWIVLAAFVGAALGLASTLLGVGGPYGGAVLALSLMAFSLVIQDETFRRLMHLVGQMLCWIEVTHRAGWVFKAEAGLKAAFKHGSSTSFIKLLCSEVSPLQNKTWTFDV